MKAISHVTVFVRDLKKAAEFYEKKLGFKRTMMAEEFGWAELKTPSVVLALSRPSGNDKKLVGRFTGIVFESKDVKKSCEELTRKGIKITEEPVKKAWGGMVAAFVDPDGNEFTLMEQR